MYQFISYWIWTSLDTFQQVQTCLRIAWILTICIILNLNKFRHVWTCSDMFEHVQTCLKSMQYNLKNLEDSENLKNLDNWVLWTFWELTCRFRSILSSDLGLDSFESCSLLRSDGGGTFRLHFWNLQQIWW